MPDSYPRGRIVWHELMTDDPDAAIAFYGKVVGWTITPFDKDPSYRMWTPRSGPPVGGVMELPAEVKQMGAPPNWMFYVAVPDADRTARDAAARGGRVLHGPADIPNVGRFAVLADPQGAVLAVLKTPDDPGGHDGPFKPGEFSWHELATTDYQAALGFYQALFGWQKMDTMDMGPAGTYQMFGRKGKMLGGMYNKPPEMPAPPHWLCYAMVPSADAAAARIKQLGGQVLNGPMDVPGGDRIAQCLDPQGAAFAVHSAPKKAAAPPPSPKPEAAKPRKAKPAKRVKAKRAKRPARKRPAKKPARRPAKKAARGPAKKR